MNVENPWKTERTLKRGPFNDRSSQKRYYRHIKTRHICTTSNLGLRQKNDYN